MHFGVRLPGPAKPFSGPKKRFKALPVSIHGRSVPSGPPTGKEWVRTSRDCGRVTARVRQLFTFSGGIMRKTAVVPVLALLLLTGCTNAESEAAPSPVSPSASLSASSSAGQSAEAGAAAAEATEEQTCSELLGTDGRGPLYQAISLVRIEDGTFGFAGSPDAAGSVDETLRGIAADAPSAMTPQLTELTQAMGSVVALAEKSSGAGFDPFAWTDTMGEILSVCARYEVGLAKPAADGASAAYPGYPMVVNAASVDYRVAAWFSGRLEDGRLVALAPGLYGPYNPNVPDLSVYYVSTTVAGDSAVKQTVFPGSGGTASWSGVRPGTEEP